MTKEEMANQQTNGGGRLMYYRVQNVEYAGISEVCSGLYISGICALKPAIMQEYGITLIINATSEVPNSASLGDMPRMKLWLDDEPEAWVLSYLDYTCNKILKTIAKGGKVLIHSVQGVSRCATICLAFLTKYKFKTLRDAYRHLASVRPKVEPNVGFWRQLISFEQELKQTMGSVRIVRDKKDPAVLIPDVYLKFAAQRPKLRQIENCATTSIKKAQDLSTIESQRLQQSGNGADQKNSTKRKHDELSAGLAAGVAAAAVGFGTGMIASDAWNQKSRKPRRKYPLSKKFSPVLEPLPEVVEAAA